MRFIQAWIRAMAVVALFCGGAVQAQPYPSHPIRLIVPFAVGGPSDISARALAAGLQQELGQAVIVDNRPGSAAIVGVQALLGAPADGYTIMMASNIIVTGKWLYKKLPYDPLKDFRAIAGVSKSPVVVLVPGKSPYKNMEDLMQAARARPGELNYGSAGLGTIPQLANEFFLQKTGLNMKHIPFKGSGQAMPAVMAGQVDVFFDVALSAQSQAGNDAIRAIGVVSPSRLAQLPDVPTLAEQGITDFDVAAWFGLVGRATLPNSVVATLNAAVNKVLATPAFRKQITTLGGVPLGGSPEDFHKMYVDEYHMWGKVIPAAGLRLD
ncbi:MAG: tripartite tricarboxylate transporter substrate binding protein [Pigmentiphaga sp.]|uniref:Bug family tripartite tricarboxylate transporter substrate binding protein n=1 Tax=Pigmentiphaga sp. TaxID=1977564 RepID=UPI0029B308F4|nr:tripartite tricarboxylate transporter substrate binding protein [Pigmentiphaga sp.]MDX3905734.1 tripartite tricarboxylate transporter substrate binding protein [Pigmentiphaga sp.]